VEDGTVNDRPVGRTSRRFDYERRLVPNKYLAALEPESVTSLEEAHGRTHLSVGYPAWNLLYYALFCSLDPKRTDLVVIETGTHRGLSTLVMAQALKDLGAQTKVETVETNPELLAAAKENVTAGGLSSHVEFHSGDSLTFLSSLAERVDHIDFIFLDDDHTREHVVAELEIVCPKVKARHGIVYFDNTTRGGVADALDDLRRIHAGNLIEFPNCSWGPPGNAIWQPG
jgi:predicted O-methyltransferase YrrM